MSDPQFGMYTENKSFEHETANFEFAVAAANRPSYPGSSNVTAGTHPISDQLDGLSFLDASGIGVMVLTAWAVVIRLDEPLAWAERAGGDLLLAGIGVAFVVAGLPTFAAGVI